PPAQPILEHGQMNLRILNYNVHGLPLPGFDTAHFGHIGRVLKQRRLQGTAPQIVAIQEGFHKRIVDLINEAGYPYSKAGPGPTFERTGSGLIILSEFPIVAVKTMTFNIDNFAGVDINARKGIEYTQIQLPGLATPLEVLDTHLQADYDDAFTPLYESIAARRRQIKELGIFFNSVTSQNGPLVFGGDFNTNPTIGDYFDIISQTYLTDAAEGCLPRGRCTGAVDPFDDLSHSLDHQFYRPSASVKMEPISYDKTFTELVNGKPLSDHDGLEVVYRVIW
ncbi:endonuclease/exonuclease/phosphatase family protein, partial [Bdellovibrionota bacterium FG-2]